MNIRDAVNKQIKSTSIDKIEAKNISATNISVGKIPAKNVQKPVESAASEDDFVWYVYSSSIGMKFNSDPGTNELILKEGSSFGIRPTEGNDDTLDLVADDTGMNVIFRIPSDVAETLIDRSSEDEGGEEEESEEETSEE